MTVNTTIFDTGWATSALSRPAAFGESLPDVWLKTCVVFKRGVAVRDGRGGSTAGEPVEYMSQRCHVVTDKVRIVGGTVGALTYKHQVKVRLRIPAILPQPGDTIEWTDDLCRFQRMFVTNVASPLSLSDHLLVYSELFD